MISLWIYLISAPSLAKRNLHRYEFQVGSRKLDDQQKEEYKYNNNENKKFCYYNFMMLFPELFIATTDYSLKNDDSELEIGPVG